MTVSDENLLAHVEKLLTASKSKSFLGREFLTWLWYLVEKNDSPMHVQSPRTGHNYLVDIWIDDRLVLESQAAKAHVQTLKGGDPSRSVEAATALLTGKSVKEMRVGFNLDSMGDFTFNLNGSDLAPRTIALPEPPAELSQEEGFSQLSFRLKASQVLVDVIDGLFALFLDERTDETWNDKGLGEIKAWMKQRTPDLSSSSLH
ncbi:hypothetical protein [Pseudobacteriovorax antillogorgiicola]|uniref:Uncharacterized protein n=1 Tax=Pseudobacteriovorax antillogorgiicola TaxID=1513793 RepID=A0A1Y6B2M5_9BACT|nr:hypothetical protein [Pseudobacteriovorax antillogorgiicola]TCS59437.1 hypothetical protein EDD56_101348 [Pseudobacteriovorax antillogorgiicola]SME88290.1 hypothetical protein SAMN06296036_101137 [Pseudobacteriovorax antillogorgiicola]